MDVAEIGKELGRKRIDTNLAQRQKYFADRVVAGEAVVIEDVQVKYSVLQLLNGEAYMLDR